MASAQKMLLENYKSCRHFFFFFLNKIPHSINLIDNFNLDTIKTGGFFEIIIFTIDFFFIIRGNAIKIVISGNKNV